MVGVDDLDGEGEAVFDLAGVVGVEGTGDESWGGFDGGFAVDDLEAGLGRFVEEDDGLAVEGMAGEGVLGVLVAQVDLVSLFDDDLAFGGFGGGVDFGVKDAGGGTGFGGGEDEGWVGVDLHFDFHAVAVEADIEIEVDYLGNDAVTGFDAEEFLAGAIDRAAAVAGEVIADGGDLSVVVGGGEGFGEEAVALLAAGGEFVEVGDLDGVAGSEFEDVVVGEFEDVLGGRDVFVAAAGDFDVVDGDGFAAVFEELELEVAEFTGRHGEGPAVLFLSDLARGEGDGFGKVGDGGRVEVGGVEGTEGDGGGLVVFPGAEGCGSRHFRGGDGEDGEVVDATGGEDIDAAVALADGEFEAAVDHDRGAAAGDFEAHGAVAFLDEGSGPDEEVGVGAFFGGLPGEGIDLLQFGGFDFAGEVGDLFPRVAFPQLAGRCFKRLGGACPCRGTPVSCRVRGWGTRRG